MNVGRKKYNNLGIFIQARLGSRRFPRKILNNVYNKMNVIEYLITRLLKVFDKDLHFFSKNGVRLGNHSIKV